MASEQQPKFVAPELQIGKKLTDARRKQRLRLNHVARELNIKESYLKALEEDDYAAIPGRAYALGFLRTYAERLELDADKFVKEVQESGVLVGDPFYDMPTPVEEGGLPTRQVMLIALAALVVVGLSAKGWQMYSDRTPAEELVVAEISEIAEPVAVVEEQEPAPIVVAKAPESKGDVVAKAAAPVVAPAPKVEPVVEAAPVAEAAAPEAVVEVAAPVLPEKPRGARILLQAKGSEVWVQIRRPSANNRILVSRTLQDGEGYWVRNWSDVVLDAGRPHNLAIHIDDAEIGMLNTVEARVQNLQLDANYLKNEYFAQGMNTKRLPQEEPKAEEPAAVEEKAAPKAEVKAEPKVEAKVEPKAEEKTAAPVAVAPAVTPAPAAAPVAAVEEEGATPEPTEVTEEPAPEQQAEQPKLNPLAMPPMRW